MKGIISLFLVLHVSCILAQQAPETPEVLCLPIDSAGIPREHEFDFEHLRLKASFVPEKGLIKAELTHVFNCLRAKADSMVLDAPGIRISSIRRNGESLKYAMRNEQLIIYLNRTYSYKQRDSLTIQYEANPRAGLYFIGWNDATVRSRRQIWSQGQGIDNRHWIPMYDEMNDKITSEMIISMPDPYKVLSNGKFLGNKNGVWHYKMTHPHAPYLIMLGIGEYEIEERVSASGVKNYLWYYPGEKEKMLETYRYSTEMLDFFEKEIGVPYPWENYSQIPVQDFMYGAMENTTATVFGDFFFVDKREAIDRTYIGVNAHELAHQWFGDMVTARSKSHHWLQESFATHYNTLYEAEVFGEDFRMQAFRNAQNASIMASQRDLYPLSSSKAGSTRWYPKGASVLFMLRYVAGNENYRNAIKYYLQKHAYGNVDSEDLLNVFQEACGLSLDWFWEQWIYRGGEPVWKVNASHEAGKSVFELTQMQLDEPYVSVFKMPVILELHFKDGSMQRDSVFVDEEQERFEMSYDAAKQIDYALFDPGNKILKYMIFEKSPSQLFAQARKARYMTDRLDAVIEMSEIPLNDKRKVLQEIVQSKDWYSVRSEAIDQLKADDKSRKILSALANDPDVKVRKALLQAYDTLPDWMMKPALQLMLDSSYALQEDALRKLCLSDKKQVNKYLKLCEKETGNNSKNVRIAWLGISIEHGNNTHLNELNDYVSNSFEFGTRRNAINELIRIGNFNETAMKHAFDAACNPNARLASAGRGYLSRMIKNSPENATAVNNMLESERVNAPDWKIEVINKIKG
jgi:aminopeptidase N